MEGSLLRRFGYFGINGLCFGCPAGIASRALHTLLVFLWLPLEFTLIRSPGYYGGAIGHLAIDQAAWSVAEFFYGLTAFCLHHGFLRFVFVNASGMQWGAAPERMSNPY